MVSVTIISEKLKSVGTDVFYDGILGRSVGDDRNLKSLEGSRTSSKMSEENDCCKVNIGSYTELYNLAGIVLIRYF